MAGKKPGLGKPLSALLGSRAVAGAEAEAEAGEALRRVPVERIRRGRFQPRQEFDPEALNELADSIRAQGVVQPVVVRPVEGEGFELIAGERRWRAAQLAGLHEIPAVVREVDDRAAMAMALIENIQRENLNPMDEAAALQRLVDEFGLTHQEAAEAVGRSRAAVSNLLRLLGLADEVKALVARRELEMGHARALLALAGEAQVQAARKVVARGLSVRETEALVRRLQAGGRKPAAAPGRDPDVRRLEERLSEKLGARVALQHGKGGRGRLVIHYTSLDELDGILARIK